MPLQKLPLSRPIVAACALALAGCSSVSNVLSGDKVDYRSGSTMRESTLDVPPDLTQLSRDSRYLPSGGSISAASYQSARASSGATVTVAPNQLGTARIERAGNQRWLVVDMPPEQLWPKLRSFWQELGLTLTLDSPEAGVMETEWAENRAKLPNDIIRRTLGRVLDSLYSTGEVDRYRTRVERTAQGGSEIYISHRGMEEVYVDQRQEITRWQPRPADPELEAVMLTRLLTHLGQSPEQARTLHEQARQAPARARVVEQGGTIGVQIDDGFDRAWRRLGLSLDRSGFTVEDRDRARGLYFVRYVPPRPPQPEPGLLGRMFGRGNDETPSPQRYRIALQSEGDRSLVLVQNEQGEPDRSQTARRIVNLLAEDLR
ncbi:outer membrane protein assembly factor BamC [Caldimonas taiwanensis]|uniref:outer membrane protein assembly factor BamC n=1 Tax=Caldimonas taiwanensis TaxID=307483 RepID=UPI000784C5C2|nr:outer membrane protein assembly factor BamC [Caldimonas taiwanensis]